MTLSRPRRRPAPFMPDDPPPRRPGSLNKEQRKALVGRIASGLFVGGLALGAVAFLLVFIVPAWMAR